MLSFCVNNSDFIFTSMYNYKMQINHNNPITLNKIIITHKTSRWVNIMNFSDHPTLCGVGGKWLFDVRWVKHELGNLVYWSHLALDGGVLWFVKLWDHGAPLISLLILNLCPYSSLLVQPNKKRLNLNMNFQPSLSHFLLSLSSDSNNSYLPSLWFPSISFSEQVLHSKPLSFFDPLMV